MKYKLITLLAGSCFLFASCDSDKAADADASAEDIAEKMGDSPEAAAKTMAGFYDQMAEALEGAEDKESAEKAIDKIGTVMGKMAEVAKIMKGKEGEEPSVEVQEKVMGIMKSSTDRFQAALQKAMPLFAQNPELMTKFQAAMSKMSQLAQ